MFEAFFSECEAHATPLITSPTVLLRFDCCAVGCRFALTYLCAIIPRAFKCVLAIPLKVPLWVPSTKNVDNVLFFTTAKVKKMFLQSKYFNRIFC